VEKERVQKARRQRRGQRRGQEKEPKIITFRFPGLCNPERKYYFVSFTIKNTLIFFYSNTLAKAGPAALQKKKNKKQGLTKNKKERSIRSTQHGATTRKRILKNV
jgi:hypothetical protein